MKRKTEKIAAIISLGCPKNLVDSEAIMGRFAEAGYTVSFDIDGADVVVINTCGFLESAREESVDIIGDLVKLKKNGRIGAIAVAGCMPMLAAGELREQFGTDIDVLVGVNNRDDIVKAVELATDRIDSFADFSNARDGSPAVFTDTSRLRLTADHSAFLRIAEGCSQGCSFCTIPKIRGPFRSKPMDMVLAEARELADSGAIELNVIAQDTTRYGHDLPDGQDLPALLRELAKIDSVRWIRLMYAYPTGVSDELIGTIADCDKVVKYLDMPLQHIDDAVLKAMGRKMDAADTIRLLEKLRSRIDGLTLRTTFIVGHPGETDEAFNKLHKFVKDFRFDAMGAFAYSPEPGTISAKLPDQVPPEVADSRLDKIMLTQQEIVFAANEELLGKTVDLIVDGVESDGVCIGRHSGQAPEIDSVCLLTKPAQTGKIIKAKIIEFEDYDLVAKPLK